MISVRRKRSLFDRFSPLFHALVTVAAILSGGLVNFPQGCLKGDEGIYHCVDFTFTGYRS
ncbi:hypothetical protein CGH10_17960 [Vibrio parahaemolyticus]|nr:hypothetical protein CGH10_17960 [Vibrio parahaemolyticus]